ncbi:hypothetical protein CANCADRAFT_3655 [Tortispora caseinolytica NRRL Y-17796]|uniref:F-box domain-containing protein n=1 Tax=Tortispora caseinolytica NRRL Y-17796 TaxID=767744 RepID=A0A1E4TBJ3_9ASCO|nr:hypothetical protein CANCADRAFT_3655 [Tortispora caseinolytica NRRL Y-17796]
MHEAQHNVLRCPPSLSFAASVWVNTFRNSLLRKPHTGVNVTGRSKHLNIVDLPDKILAKIADYSHFYTVFIVRQVCRKLRHSFHETTKESQSISVRLFMFTVERRKHVPPEWYTDLNGMYTMSQLCALFPAYINIKGITSYARSLTELCPELLPHVHPPGLTCLPSKWFQFAVNLLGSVNKQCICIPIDGELAGIVIYLSSPNGISRPTLLYPDYLDFVIASVSSSPNPIDHSKL